MKMKMKMKMKESIGAKLFEFELDDDGVVGRAESGGQRFGKSWGGAHSLFDGRIHCRIARGAGDSEEGDRSAIGDFDLHLGIDLFSSGNRGFFPGGLDRLFDQRPVPGEVVSHTVGSAGVACPVTSAPASFTRDF